MGATAQILLPVADGTLGTPMTDEADEFPPEYWVSRAHEARVLAERMHAPECRTTMLEIAAGFEYMAEAALRLRQYGDGLMKEIGLAPLAPAVKSALS